MQLAQRNSNPSFCPFHVYVRTPFFCPSLRAHPRFVHLVNWLIHSKRRLYWQLQQLHSATKLKKKAKAFPIRMATTNSARKILKSLLSNTPSCDSASSVEVRTATSESNSVSDASDVRGVIAMDGLLKYEDLIALLSCSLCQKFCGKSIVQCRKGVIVVVDWCVVKK